MNKLEIMNKLTRTFGRAGLRLKKHSPEILIVTGVVGVVASAVMACKATTKLGDVLEDAKNEIDYIHDCKNDSVMMQSCTEEENKKALAMAYIRTGVELAKLYGPSVVLGVTSIGCILTSNNIMRKRNVALSTAYMAVDKGFKEYRNRVIERFGKEVEHEIKHNIKAKEIETVVVDENGGETTVTEVVNVMDNPNNFSPYSIVFDDGNVGWDKDPELSKYFLIQQQNYANDLLKSRGHLFLNEVYDMLGAKRTVAGQTVGWYYDEENPTGDNFVDFGLFDIHRPKARDFINGYERVIVLDFNVDGDILNYI